MAGIQNNFGGSRVRTGDLSVLSLPRKLLSPPTQPMLVLTFKLSIAGWSKNGLVDFKTSFILCHFTIQHEAQVLLLFNNVCFGYIYSALFDNYLSILLLRCHISTSKMKVTMFNSHWLQLSDKHMAVARFSHSYYMEGTMSKMEASKIVT